MLSLGMTILYFVVSAKVTLKLIGGQDGCKVYR